MTLYFQFINLLFLYLSVNSTGLEYTTTEYTTTKYTTTEYTTTEDSTTAFRGITIEGIDEKEYNASNSQWPTTTASWNEQTSDGDTTTQPVLSTTKRLKTTHRSIIYIDGQTDNDYCCTFDINMCGWYQPYDLDWIRKSTSESTTGTWLPHDHASSPGYYLYIDTSRPRTTADTARMLGPPFISRRFTDYCFSFWYYMNGYAAKQLNVYTKSNLHRYTKIWTKNGIKSKGWERVGITIPYSGELLQIMIEGVVRTNNGYGVIAIDNTDLKVAVCRGTHIPAGYLGCFQDSYFINPLDYFLYRSDSNSGEKCTLGCRSQGYRYAGTTGSRVCYCGNKIKPYKVPNYECDAVCPGNRDEFCGGIWKLSMYDTAVSDISGPVMSTSGYQSAWQSYDCTFDDSVCGWQQSVQDDFNWTRKRDGTMSTSTGPRFDHTTMTMYGHYLYIETSSPRIYNDYAEIFGPSFRIDKGQTWCFSFWYNMYGRTIGSLTVYISDGKSKNSIWTINGNQGTSWLKASVNITGNGLYKKIVLKGRRGTGYTGDIAIDDTSITRSPCKVTPHVNIDTVTSKTNSGGSLDSGTVVLIVAGILLFLCFVFGIGRAIRRRFMDENIPRDTTHEENRSRSRPFTITCSMTEIQSRTQTLTVDSQHSTSRETNSDTTNQTENTWDPPDYETLFTTNGREELESSNGNGIVSSVVRMPGIDERTDDTTAFPSDMTSNNPEEDTPPPLESPPAYWSLSTTYFRPANGQSEPPAYQAD
ncbi:MAM and LDL-receptor class A domain-containing protein 1-like isoform X2 [Mercenaria mercenaria]|uniref:MAM and LDL-receptor class A domain-containing protein 1-like isoform X2 n=1 Tax=Mercenaria mercenaria TaxID=6596 RepID=UPI00234F77CB|nr:MAM and LDL-receptor class A domain-containing protein 1-like isoform X2 [Mercenaria mercenaria]